MLNKLFESESESKTTTLLMNISYNVMCIFTKKMNKNRGGKLSLN